VITKINGKELAVQEADTLKALSLVTIEGEIQTPGTGTLQTTFNGQLQVTVYDKANTITTLGTERSSRMNFQLQQNVLYEGRAKVENGLFRFSFVVPKDIDYLFDSGKISLYAKEDATLRDAAGARLVIVGGSTADAATDITPPRIQLFMNDTTFVSGSITGSNTSLLAHIFDENGINITRTGIGHAITATLRSQEDTTLILNEYYTAGPDTYQQGQVHYPFTGLKSGRYHLTLKAWDTHNNSGEANIDFIVTGSEQLALHGLLNYPNPMGSYTSFAFDHNRAGEPLDIQVEIFNNAGQVVKVMHIRLDNSPEHIGELYWDGMADKGNKLSKGVYIYRITVRSMADHSSAQQVNKLVIIQ
jgi:hypothetical protein